MRAVVLLSIAAAAAGLGGCAASEGLSLVPPCDSSLECHSSEVCLDFQCRRADDLPGTFHVEVTPSDGEPPISTQMLAVDSQELLRGPLAVTLDPLVAIRARLFDEGGAELDGTIALVAANRIPGRERILVRDLFREDETSQRIAVPAGMYRATIKRADGRPGKRTTLDIAQPEELRISFAQPRRMFGVVSSSLGPIAGARVRANGTLSGLVSTTGVSDASGQYSIELPETEETALRLEVEVAQPAWGYEELLELAPGIDDIEKPIVLVATPSSLPTMKRIRLLDAGRVPAPPGLVVTFTATRAADVDTRVYKTRGETDADGFVRVLGETGPEDLTVLPAAYEMTVVPSNDSRIARSTQIVDLSSGSGNVELVTLPRSKLNVQLESRDGGTVSRAAFEARDSDVLSLAALASSTGSGRVETLLDPGPYVFVVKPSDPALPVSVAEAAIGGDTSISIAIPLGVEAHGQVVRDGDPVRMAKVEVFLPLRGRAISLGTTVTDMNGRFRLIVPSDLSGLTGSR